MLCYADAMILIPEMAHHGIHKCLLQLPVECTLHPSIRNYPLNEKWPLFWPFPSLFFYAEGRAQRAKDPSCALWGLEIAGGYIYHRGEGWDLIIKE